MNEKQTGNMDLLGKRSEMKTIIYLSIPVLIANLTNMGMGCVDTIVAGSASSVDMASVSLGASVFIPVQLFACGILMVLGPIVANYRGRDVARRSGYVMHNGLWLALLLGACVIGIESFAGSVFDWISPDPAMRRIATGYLHAILWGAPANLIFVALRSLNEGSNMTRPAMFVGISSLLLNIPLNYIFVFGWFGLPAMGGSGCGAATAVIYWFQALAMFGIVYLHPEHRLYRRHIIALRRPARDMLGRVLKIGFPVGISMFCEVLLFCGASLVLAPLGYIQVGSHQVACNVASMLFMIPLSIGLAASIRVAYHNGARDRAGALSAIRSSYALVLGILVLSALFIIFFNRQVVMLFNDDPAIVGTASMLLLLGVIYQLPDCLQVVSAGILRGFRDTGAISIITFISYWIIGFPVGFILSRTTWVTSEIMGANGIWIGFIFGLSAASIMLIFRLIKTCRREFSLMSAETHQ